jgi:CRISPR-associated protein Cas5 subtype I-A
MKIYLTTIMAKTHWGYSIRTFPASATQKSIAVPPPTTIVGALACAYATTSKLNREYSLVGKDFMAYPVEFLQEFDIKYATLHLHEQAGEQTLQTIRYFTMPVQAPKADIARFAETLKVAEMFGPVQIGYVAAPLTTLTLTILSSKPLPKEAAWSISRLGSRDSLIAIEKTTQSEVELQKVNMGEKIYLVNTYYPMDLAAPQPPATYTIERMPIPLSREEWLQWFSFRPHSPSIERNVIIPLPRQYTPVKILKNCFKISIKADGDMLTLLIPMEVM